MQSRSLVRSLALPVVLLPIACDLEAVDDDLDFESEVDVADIPSETDVVGDLEQGTDDEAQWWWSGPKATNTNVCVADLGGIQACQDQGALGLPSDLAGCCDGVRALAEDRCECNPTVDVLLGEGGDQIYDLEPLCRLVQPKKWTSVVPRPLRSCYRLQRHDYGCELDDMEMDAARLTTILEFASLFDASADENVCFDTPSFVEALEEVFEPEAGLFVPYGIGTYAGYHDMAEYLGLAFASLNHGYWILNTGVDPSKPARLEVSFDGSTWIQGSTSSGEFARGLLPYDDAYVEQQVEFEGCETRMSGYDVLPTDGLRDEVEFFVQTVDLSRRWGIEDICRYHTTYCAPDPATRQFPSEQACLTYMRALPLYTPACGPNRPLSGHSLPCKLKHHFMIPTNPELHCPHIGPLGNADPNAHFKCDDATECADPNQGVSWPAVSEIGANTPQEIIDLFDDSNVGWETEPFGCAVPSDAPGHAHGG